MAESTIPKQHDAVIPIESGGTGATNATSAKAALDIVHAYGNKSGSGNVITFTDTVYAILIFMSSTDSRVGVYLLRGFAGSASNVLIPILSSSALGSTSAGTGTLTLNFSATVTVYAFFIRGGSENMSFS